MINNGLFTVIGLGAGMALAIALLWTLIWKGFALWIAARENKKWWFLALLILNTVGILEILYIFLFSKWGKEYIARLKNSKNTKTSSEFSKCECTTCDGCNCSCHKPIES